MSDEPDLPRNDASKLPKLPTEVVDVDQAVYDQFLEKQRTESRDALAAALLFDLCYDMLNVQIGTRMFWKDDDALKRDHFAEYVYLRLQDSCRQMGWKMVDSASYWLKSDRRT